MDTDLIAGQPGEAHMVYIALTATLLMVFAGLAKKRLEWRQRRPLWHPLQRCGRQRRRSNK
jgi:hypothetical protein